MAEENSEGTINWTASEYIDHQRGVLWYLILVAGTVVLAGIIYLVTKDKMATGIVVILGLIVASVARWKPQQVDYRLSAKGLHIREKFYPSSLFRSYAILHEGELSSLTFTPVKKFSPPISVFFDEQDEERIMELLGEHLPMEEGRTDRVDRLSRLLRF
ncbi:MAG: hypothetical protein JWO96_190 [Candidatus Saccharibacteria bacterium]|nr:hypothetical protein [Candidatus Saccharibacteria bacterium]